MGISASLPALPASSVEIPGSGDAGNGIGPSRRHPYYVDHLRRTYFEGVNTLFDAFERGLQLSADEPCLGCRPVVGEEPTADGKGVQPKLGEFQWTTYRQVAGRRDRIGSGLVHEQLLTPKSDMGKDMNMMAIYSRNTEEWVLMEQACNAFGGVVVPLYDSLGVKSVAYVLGLTGMRSVAVEQNKIDTILTVKEEEAGAAALQAVVVLAGGWTPEQAERAKRLGVRLLTLSMLEEAGHAHPTEHRPPAADDVATVCFTSGTTGNPKGAVLTHGNFLAVAGAPFFHGVNLQQSDFYLSYLPLAHIMERAIQAALWSVGARVGMYNGNTLRIVEDIKALRPTFFASVPRLFNKIHDKLVAGVAAKGAAAKALFDRCLDEKKYWLKRGFLEHSICDPLIFNGVKAKVGLDRCRLMLTGSAPIAPHVMEFVRCVFWCPVVEGFGQTETAACVTLTDPAEQTSLGHVGGPAACCEIRLDSVPELGYLVTDRVHRNDGDEGPGVPCQGRGEVCFRGPNIFLGYLDNPEKTAESFAEGRWLRSGDLAMWDEHGRLRIVGRKSVNFKLSQGEFVRPEHLENVYARNELFQQVFVYGDSLQSVLVAVIVPEAAPALAWAAANGKPSDLAKLCEDREFNAHVLAEIRRTGKGCGLSGFEIARAVHVEAEPFSVENGLLTPTFKLKRRPAGNYFRAQIDAMYESVGGVTSGLRQGATEGPAAGGGGAGQA